MPFFAFLPALLFGLTRSRLSFFLLVAQSFFAANAQFEVVQQTKHSATITAIAISADGRYLATSEYYIPRIFIWDNYSRKKIMEIPTEKDVLDLAFSPNGN